MHAVAAAAAPMVKSVSTYLATGLIALALWAGWYGRRLWQSGQDVTAARARLRLALRAAWAARRIAVLVGFAIFVAARFWLRKHGA